MKKLTNQMDEEIFELYYNNSYVFKNKVRLKILIESGFLTNNGDLSTTGKIYVISKMNLSKQCEALNIDIENVILNYERKPETALLNHLISQGYVGSSSEGVAIFTVLKALMLDKLTKYNFLNSREDACTRYLEAQLTILKDKSNELISSITKTDKKTYIRNFQEIISQPYISLSYPDLSIDFADAIFDSIDTNLLIKLASKIAEDPYNLRSGWPDLTVVKDYDVQFIEVKTTDKFNISQLFTIPIIREILPFRFSVCRVKKIKA